MNLVDQHRHKRVINEKSYCIHIKDYPLVSFIRVGKGGTRMRRETYKRKIVLWGDLDEAAAKALASAVEKRERSRSNKRQKRDNIEESLETVKEAFEQDSFEER